MWPGGVCARMAGDTGFVALRICDSFFRGFFIGLFDEFADHAIEQLRIVWRDLENFFAIENDAGGVVGFERGFRERLFDGGPLRGGGVFGEEVFEAVDQIDWAVVGFGKRAVEVILLGRLSAQESGGRDQRNSGEACHLACEVDGSAGAAARMLSASAAARSRAMLRKLSFFATRSSMGRNCSCAIRRLLVAQNFETQDGVLRAELIEADGALEIDARAFAFCDLLEEIVQRPRIHIFGVVEFGFVRFAVAFPAECLRAHVGDLEARFERMRKMIEAAGKIEHLSWLRRRCS